MSINEQVLRAIAGAKNVFYAGAGAGRRINGLYILRNAIPLIDRQTGEEVLVGMFSGEDCLVHRNMVRTAAHIWLPMELFSLPPEYARMSGESARAAEEAADKARAADLEHCAYYCAGSVT